MIQDLRGFFLEGCLLIKISNTDTYKSVVSTSLISTFITVIMMLFTADVVNNVVYSLSTTIDAFFLGLVIKKRHSSLVYYL